MTASSVRVTVLVENHSARADVGAEHGLAVLIERGGEAVLLDTGASDLLVKNARVLGADLSAVRSIALSHGHYDHSGGLAAALEAVHPQARVCAHPAALGRKYAVRPGKPVSEIGVKLLPDNDRLDTTTGAQELLPGVLWLGQIPRTTEYEDTGGPFFLDPTGKTPDQLLDDTSLLISTPAGPVLISGCAHAGIVNTVRHAAGHVGARRFAAVLGGMHLGGASEQRVAQTITDLGEFEIEMLGPMHCTGEAATCAFRDAYGERCREPHAGSVLEF
jgi:7,8-dihydropterin-6-yl-methyl-4-(beta-D-ribofuranosyl)aminobenzene 5'-phosphate synthase